MGRHNSDQNNHIPSGEGCLGVLLMTSAGGSKVVEGLRQTLDDAC